MSGTLRLADHGRVFATRTGAAIVLDACPEGPLTINIDGVRAAAPAFVDELLLRLLRSHPLTIEGGDRQVRELFDRTLARLEGGLT